MSRPIDDPAFQEAFIAAANRRAAGPPLALELDVSATLAVIGQLQLALRHPGNAGPTAAATRRFVRDLITAVVRGAGPDGSDARTLRRGLDAGFDPTCDVADDPARSPEGFKAWYRALPESWRAGLWNVLLDGKAFVGELPANPQAGLRAVAVLFMPWEAGQRAAERFEAGELS